LNVKLQQAERSSLIAQEITRLYEELRLLQPEIVEIDTKRTNWLDLLGHAPALPSGDLKNYSAFFWYLRLLRDHLEVSIELAAQQSMLQEADYQREDTLKLINEQFNSLHAPVSDGPRARAAIKQLSESENSRQNIEAVISGLRDLAAEKKRQLTAANEKLDSIYKSLGLEAPDKLEAYRLIDQLKEYKELESTCKEKLVLFNEMERLQNGHEMFARIQAVITVMSLDTAREQLKEFVADAAKFDHLNEQIIQTQALVAQEKNGHALEDALSDKEAALERPLVI